MLMVKLKEGQVLVIRIYWVRKNLTSGFAKKNKGTTKNLNKIKIIQKNSAKISHHLKKVERRIQICMQMDRILITVFGQQFDIVPPPEEISFIKIDS